VDQEAAAAKDFPVLHTERLTLRPPQADDLAAIVELAGAREVAATTLRIPHPYTEADGRSFLAACQEAQAQGERAMFAICRGAELIGMISLEVKPAHAHAELGYWIGVPYWGHGYCTEAARAVVKFGFETLKLHRIYAGHFAGNPASMRVLEKLGMRYEGCARGHVQKWGKFLDVENYALLAEDYQRRRNP